MSKVYYDHLLAFDEIEKIVNKHAKSEEEKAQLWGLIDEIIHHKALDVVLSKLDKNDHEEFIEIFHKHPHDNVLIFGYLDKKVNNNFEEYMRQKLQNIADEIILFLG